jgi:NodT family efflux transporter outer membrane factor (OMF) lipoprotein
MIIYLVKKHTLYCLSIALLVLTGCSVGPRYEPPTTLIPTQWNGQNETNINHNAAWWRQFHDPILNKLIEQKAVYNLNLKTAKERVETARAEYKLATAQLFPTLSANAFPPNGTGFDLTQVIALTAAIDPDFFGKIRQNRQRIQANLEAEQANQDFTLINLYAEIASTYLEFREAQAKEDVIKHDFGGNKQMLALLNSRYTSGLTNYINIAQQDALMETQLAELEQNKAHMMMLLHKIEILTGYAPGGLAKFLLPHKPIPQMTQPINLGVPAELLRRRPDIIAAERRVAAAHANIRVAIASLFPQISVGWLLGWQTQTISNNIIGLHNPDSTFFGTFNAPLLDARVYQNIDVKKREKIVAILQYEMTVLTALHDVETQANYCRHYKASAGHLKHAVKQKRLVLKLAKNTYQKGAADFNTVIRSEEDLNHLEIAYLHNIVIYQLAKINLYKALGGGIYEHPP